MRWLRTKLSRLFRRRKHEAELDAELAFHLEELVADFERQGMSPADARDAARRELGDVGSYREEVRDAWRPPELAEAWRTIRFAARSLLRTPAFTALAVVTLAVGIGGNTVMYSFFQVLVLKPPPYPQPDDLYRIDRATAHEPHGHLAPVELRELAREQDGFGEVAGYALDEVSIAEPGQPADMARGLRATTNLLAVLGVPPQLGRDFAAGEDVAGHDRVVILSRRLWRNRFGSRADIVGTSVRIDGVPHEVIGVMPETMNDWRHLGSVDLIRPLALDAAQAADRGNRILRVIARRAAAVSPHAAEGFIAAFGARLAKAHPEVDADSAWRAVTLPRVLGGQNGKQTMAMLIGLSAFVLLIACSNLANLLLARTVGRARELAVRAALGASRGQLLRPLVTEALVLAAAGAAGALLVARWLADYFSMRSTGDNGERVLFPFDWTVFGWAGGAALVTAVAFGLAPALFAMRLNLCDTLKSGARGVSGGRGHRRFRSVLVVGQFALAMVLTAGAGLFIRGLDELNGRRAGWSSDHLAAASLALPASAYPDDARVADFQRRAVARLAAVPGVATASLSTFAPFFDSSDLRRFFVDGAETPAPGREPAALVNDVTPAYFDTAGTRVVAGRAFDDRDRADAPRVAIINQAMAAALFGGESPLGRRLVPAGGTPRAAATIVGVVADVRSVLPDPPGVTFQLYQPMAQEPQRHVELLVRASGPPAAVLDGIRAAIHDLDPDLPVRDLKTADATIDRANYTLAVLRDVLAMFAALGLGLALLGVYGVIARTTALRRNEFAIRFALGARVRDVTRLVVGSGLRLALTGAALGLAGAFGVARLLSHGYPGMRLASPAVLAASTLLLVAVALLACWLPARRAAQIHPMESLRAD